MNLPPRALAPFLILCVLLVLPAQSFAAPAAGEVDPSMLPENQNRFALQFIADYQSWDVTRVAKWISPRRGLVDSRVLKTKDQFIASFPEIASALKAAKLSYKFGYGQFEGPRFYKCLFAQTGGKLGDLPSTAAFSLMCVFENIGDQWYLVQAHKYDPHSSAWPTIGDKVDDNRLKGTTLANRMFSLGFATGKDYAVLLSFFDQTQDYWTDDNLNHLRTVKKWYQELKGQPIYVMNVNEDSKEQNEAYFHNNNLQMPLVLDSASEWHIALQVDQHPYLLLIDSTGTLRSYNRQNYDPKSYALFRQIVSDVIAESPAANSGQKSGTKAVDPSSKF